MINKVLSTIKDYSLFNNGDCITVALSGGSDSVALLHILNSLKPHFNILLKAVHINHCIRGDEAVRDEEFVKSLCESLNIELFTYRYDIPTLAENNKESLEECGRRVRYELFKKISSDVSLIATAHNLNDCIETMFFNLVRGSSLRGLCSIPPKRDNIIRPLINCSKDEIIAYCKENDIRYVFDSTNDDIQYSRNYIRNIILPSFENVNLNYVDNIGKCIHLLNIDSTYLDSLAKEKLNSLVLPDKSLKKTDLNGFNQAILSRIIYFYIFDQTGIYADFKHIDLLIGNIETNSYSLQLNKEYYINVTDKAVFISRRECSNYKVLEFEVNLSDNNYYSYNDYEIWFLTRKNHNDISDIINAIDSDILSGSVFLRSRRAGDEISIQKRNITKTLKKLYIENKLTQKDKTEMPVLADNNRVIWSPLTGVDKYFSITDNTKNIIEIVFKRRNKNA